MTRVPLALFLLFLWCLPTLLMRACKGSRASAIAGANQAGGVAVPSAVAESNTRSAFIWNSGLQLRALRLQLESASHGRRRWYSSMYIACTLALLFQSSFSLFFYDFQEKYGTLKYPSKVIFEFLEF